MIRRRLLGWKNSWFKTRRRGTGTTTRTREQDLEAQTGLPDLKHLSLSQQFQAPPVDSGQDSEVDVATRGSGFRLADLPVELLLALVTEHLDWPSVRALRLTSKFFASLAPSSALTTIYLRCQDDVARREEELVWTAVPKPNRDEGLPWLFGMRRKVPREKFVKAGTLPCYRCLRWLQAIDLKSSKFSCAMAQTLDPLRRHRYNFRSRLCFDCGVKTGLYVKGSRFKGHVICARCGQLGNPWAESLLRDMRDDQGKLLWGRMRHRYSRFCASCAELDSIPQSRAEYDHQRDGNFRYQKTMWKKYEKTKAIRRELGVPVGDEGNKWMVWCPVLERMSNCDCWKNEDELKEFNNRFAW